MVWFTGAVAQSGPAKCKLSVMVQMPVTMIGLRPMVNAKINGSDVRFTLDSGAFYSMISPASAAALKLKARAAPPGFGVIGVGGRINVNLAKADSMFLDGLTLHGTEFIVGGNDESGESIGLLGRNFLELGDIDFDLAQGMVQLMNAQDCGGAVLAYWAHDGDTYSVIPIGTPARVGMFETKKTEYVQRYLEPITGNAFVNGAEVRVIFDTGAPTSYLTVRAAARAGIKLDSPGVVSAGYGGGIGRGQVANYLAQVASFKIGDEEIRNTRLRLGDTNSLGSVDMLIGADFFLSHHVYVANGQHKLYFTYSGGPVFNLKTVVGESRQSPPAPSEAQTGDRSISPQGSPEPNTQAGVVAKSSAGAAEIHAPATSASAASAKPDPKRAEEADVDARRGMGFAARGQFDQALPELNRACELAPDDPDYFYQRGTVYWQVREQQKALADFDRTLQIKPNHVLALAARGNLRINMGDKAGAQADLDAADATVAKEDALHLTLARAYDRLGQFHRSVEQYDLWIASHSTDVQLYNALTLRCRSRALGDFDLQQALSDCDQALAHAKKASPFQAEALAGRGLVRLRLGNLESSIADFDDSLKIAPRDAGSLYARGVDKIRLHKAAEGEADITQAKTISADIADTFAKDGISP